jgi:subtilisin family serine protease
VATLQRVAAIGLLVIGLTPAASAAPNNGNSAAAKGRHSRQAPHVKPGQANHQVWTSKVDQQTSDLVGHSPVRLSLIVIEEPGTTFPAPYKGYVRRQFRGINAYQLDGVPPGLVSKLAGEPSTLAVHFNRSARKHDALSSAAVDANALDPAHLIANQLYPYTGSGIRVAVVDSGFSMYPNSDLSDDRVAFVNFVDTNQTRHDGDGHGTHVAGIIGGTGAINAKYAGMAPGTSVVSLKVLNDAGVGTIGDIIAGLSWVYDHPEANIRVVNMSVGAPVTQSYLTDPLTLAAKALVDRGIVVVAAAGNLGKNSSGQLQWGGITSPGIAPWVLTVCAFSTQGTYDTSDDVMAGFSSSGPTAVDFGAKPDICAPGVGIVSLADPGSTLYNSGALATPTWLIGGSAGGYSIAPYESLSGTSMATPAVSGAVALMLEANPSLTPNLVKGLLEYTAHTQPGVSPLRQGAGFMDVAGAVGLAAAYGALPLSQMSGAPAPGTSVTAVAKLRVPASWSRHVLWGNHMLSYGVIDPRGNAWAIGMPWGAAQTSGGDNIVWGTASDSDNIVWGTTSDGDNIVWGTASGVDNIVWGTASDGDNIVWGTASDSDNIVWGTAFDSDNIVWGTAFDGDNIVWGTSSDGDKIVWGTDCGGADCDVVWGSASDGDNIVWGTASEGDNIVWGTAGSNLDNIVWGTASDGDNIVWGTSAADNLVWTIMGGK